MRRNGLPSLCASVIVLGLVASASADDVKPILEKAINAHGGAEALAKYKAGHSKHKGKLTLPGVGEIDFTQEIAFMLPDKFKETLEFEIMNKKITVVTMANGDKISIEANGMAIDVTDAIKKALADARYMMRSARLATLVKDKGYEFSSLGEVKVEGKPAVGILVKSKGQKDISLFFNKETGLLAKLEHRTIEGMTGQEITEERIVLEYGKKSEQGIAMPKKILIKHDGKTFMEAEVIEAKLLEQLDDGEFKK